MNLRNVASWLLSKIRLFPTPKIFEVLLIHNVALVDEFDKSEQSLITFMQKVDTNEHKRSWKSALKSLIVLDHTVEHKIRLKVIYEHKLQSIYELANEPKNSKYCLIVCLEIHNKELMVRLFYELVKLKSEHYDGKFVEIFVQKLEDVFGLLKQYDFDTLYRLFRHLGIFINKLRSILVTSDSGYLKYELCKYTIGLCINSLDYFYKLRYFIMIAVFYSRKNIHDVRKLL